MRKITGIVTGLLLLFTLAGETAVAGENDTGWHSSLGVEHFNWAEYDADGAEILQESGPRIFVELSTESEYTPRLGAIYSGRYYGGNVDYNGQTQGGVPATSNSLYLGLTFEALFDYRVSVGRASFFDNDEWFVNFGMGYDGWYRGIQDTSTASGYNELYQLIYSKLGVLLDTNEGVRIQLGAKLPMLVSEQVGFSRFVTRDTGEELADLELAPVGNTTLYASIDYKMTDRWNFRLYYDHYLFDASPQEYLTTASGDLVYYHDSDGDGFADYNTIDDGSNPVAAHQPKSDQRTIGARFTFSY